jgi:hypothetical protein
MTLGWSINSEGKLYVVFDRILEIPKGSEEVLAATHASDDRSVWGSAPDG